MREQSRRARPRARSARSSPSACATSSGIARRRRSRVAQPSPGARRDVEVLQDGQLLEHRSRSGRCARRPAGTILCTGRPSSSTARRTAPSPAARTSPVIASTSVVLPAPLGPMRNRRSPGGHRPGHAVDGDEPVEARPAGRGPRGTRAGTARPVRRSRPEQPPGPLPALGASSPDARWLARAHDVLPALAVASSCSSSVVNRSVRRRRAGPTSAGSSDDDRRRSRSARATPGRRAGTRRRPRTATPAGTSRPTGTARTGRYAPRPPRPRRATGPSRVARPPTATPMTNSIDGTMPISAGEMMPDAGTNSAPAEPRHAGGDHVRDELDRAPGRSRGNGPVPRRRGPPPAARRSGCG